MRTRRTVAAIAALLCLSAPGLAAADPLAGAAAEPAAGPGSSTFAPLVPVSAFARPGSWFDPSRLRVSTTVSVGTGWGGRTDGLQVTSLSYQLASPLAVRLSLGNTFGASAAGRGNGMFLEGFALSYRPHPSFHINVDYRDIRSPLQYSHGPYPYPYGFGSYRR